MVGANGFEPSTSWSRTRRASQAALRPDLVLRAGIQFTRDSTHLQPVQTGQLDAVHRKTLIAKNRRMSLLILCVRASKRKQLQKQNRREPVVPGGME